MVRESFREVVEFPPEIAIEVSGKKVVMRGSGKELCRVFKVKGISFKRVEKGIEVEASPAKRRMRARLKTVVGHLRNMAAGLTKEFEYKLAIVFSHFPMSVNVKGNLVEINNFAGEKKPRVAKILPGVSVEVKGKDVFVRSADKEAAGQTAANLENATRVSGRDRRVFQDGIFIVSKPKAGVESG